MKRIGVVGCGYWGPNIIRNFNSLKDCRVKTVCDLNETRLAHIKSLYHDVETTTNYDQLVNDSEIDAIAIATPVHTHFPLASLSLGAGKHTLIEKPMAASVAECMKLKELAEEKNVP